MNTTRADRLRYLAAELVNIRENLTVLTGSPKCAEVRMCRDLEMALVELIKDASRPRSRPGVPAVYVAPQTREAARPEAQS